MARFWKCFGGRTDLLMNWMQGSGKNIRMMPSFLAKETR